MANTKTIWNSPEDNQNLSTKMNWLRAGVLGANDGIVSTAGLVLGMVGATTSHGTILLAGVAGLVSGALSMAAGEYVSVSSQRDTEKAQVHLETHELKTMPEEELQELIGILESKGLSSKVATEAAKELTLHNDLAAHAEMELGIKLGEYTNPWQAALASALSFACGAVIPLVTVVASPADYVGWITTISVIFALSITGVISARLGKAPVLRATMRNVLGGLLAMLLTHSIGRLFGGGVIN